MAQQISELIAIPIDLVIRRFREHNSLTAQNAASKANKICDEIGKCLHSGMYTHMQSLNGGTGEEPGDSDMLHVARQTTNFVLYKGVATPIQELAKMENFQEDHAPLDLTSGAHLGASKEANAGEASPSSPHKPGVSLRRR